MNLSNLTPRQLGFKLDNWRPYQIETAEKIYNSEKPIVILSAPTGSGKSIINQIPARISNGRQVILTRTKNLQSQYERDGVFALYGRDNYQCNIMPVKSAAYGKCRSGHDCSLMFNGCDYFDSKRTAIGSQQSVLNYRYFFLEANGPGGFSNLDYLVCDEGHGVPQELSESFTIRFGNWEFKRFKLRKPEGPIAQWIAWANSIFVKFVRQSQFYQKADIVLSARNFMSKLASLMDIQDPDNFMVSSDKAGNSIQPIWTDKLARTHLFKHAKRFIFSSATINPWLLSRELGFSLSDVEYISIPSTFPREHRPIYIRATHNIRHGTTQLELLALVRDIDKIIDDYPDKRGIIHTSNYALAETISNYSYHSGRIITHKSNTRVEALEEFKKKEGAILVSPSMMEGVDLPYELCEFTIIAKLPFPNLKDPVWEARFSSDKYRASQTYTSQTIASIIQSVGRGVRASDDYCDSWILDAAFNRIYSQNYREFPKYFREAVIQV